jgi:phosphoglycolate phosphatase-like HAD superfamily hydrolase
MAESIPRTPDTGYGRGVAVTVFDIDGVLADVRHRLHYLDERPKNWKGFFAAAIHDPVLDSGRAALVEAQGAGSGIVYVTGRPRRWRRDTAEWLHQHGLPQGPLHMRPNHDRRPARFYKAEVISRLADEEDLVAIIDDDDKVVDHLRQLGFPVLHATWMHDGAEQLDLLNEAQETEGRT